MRRSPALVACLAAALVVVGMAGPAQAVGSITDNGNGSVTVVLTGSGPSAEILYFCATSTPAPSCNSAVDLYGSLTGGTFGAGSSVFQVIPSTVVSLPAGTYNLGLYNGTTVTVSQANVVIGSSGGGGTSGGETTSSPAPIFQQFGKPASGTCAVAASASLNWAGVASGGWSESWAQWINGGNGGAVCTRTLIYNSSLGAWTIG